jgi:hypothetical protein
VNSGLLQDPFYVLDTSGIISPAGMSRSVYLFITPVSHIRVKQSLPGLCETSLKDEEKVSGESVGRASEEKWAEAVGQE